VAESNQKSGGTPAMRDYQAAYRDLSVEALERRFLQGRLATGLNACVECCDRWSAQDRAALNWVGRDLAQERVSYAELHESAGRFANLLAQQGVGAGDVVAGLLPRIPELLTVVLGTWRAGAIYQPLFTAFGPKAIAQRVTAEGGSAAKLLVTDSANRPKLDDVPGCPPTLVVDRTRTAADEFAAALARQPADFAPVMRNGSDPFVLLYTSGTTGNPKGVLYPLSLLLPVAVYMQDGLGLQPADRFWNLADPGWAYGMLYTVVGPLLLGHTTTMYEGPFTVEPTVRVIQQLGITNLAGAPTAYRLMMAAGEATMSGIAGQLRVASSAGEPLNPEVARWAQRVLQCPLKDQYGQTETAMLVVNHHGLRHPEKEGSAGLPMPGFSLDVLDENLAPVPPNTPGILAVNRVRSPLCTFAGYWKAPSPSLRGEWYLTGDTMTRDEDGHFFFVGRSDDIITSAGYRIGPFDVESALIEHPSVAEVAAIGKPDPERTEIVKAFVVLRQGIAGSSDLAAELQQHVRARLGAHAFPREIEFVPDLPKTPSGKVQRFVLRQREVK
jgi:acetyl-CoA synthetase